MAETAVAKEGIQRCCSCARGDQAVPPCRVERPLDPYVVDQPNNQYIVRSLYFDDPYYTAFNDKVEGVHTRSKFRVRTYTDDPDAGVAWFLEIRGR